MFTKINNIGIWYNFNDGITVKIKGPDNYYYAEVREFLPNQSDSYFLEGYHIVSEDQPCYDINTFRYAAKFYYDFELIVYKVDPEIGLVKVFQHRFDDRDKLVLFNIETDDFEEATLWYNKCLDYTELHGCKPVIKTKFEELNHQNKNFFLTDIYEFYTTYTLGRFPKTSTDYRSIGDKRVENTTMYNLWKKYWSYEHPREWKTLTSEEIADDILGLKLL